MSNEDSATMFNMDPVISARQLNLVYNDRTIEISPDDTPFSIGRDKDSTDLCIDSQFSSRTHCKILYQDKNFLIKDSSTNGTHVRVGVNQPIKLQGSFATLTGTGSIKLGEAIKVGDKNTIAYKIVF